MASVDNEPDCSIRKIAIVEGEGFEESFLEWEVALFDFEIVRVPRSLKTIGAIIAFIQVHADAAICFHRLALPDASLIFFCGAELVAALYDVKIPALLITQYVDIDQHTTLRKWRDKLPVVLHPRVIGLGGFGEYFTLCLLELSGTIPATRVPYRVMLQVRHTEISLSEQSVDVTIDYWDETQIVRFPLELIPENLHDRVMRGTWFFADVNIRAQSVQELYLRRFELAPEPEFDEQMLYCLDVRDQSNHSAADDNDMGFSEIWG